MISTSAVLTSLLLAAGASAGVLQRRDQSVATSQRVPDTNAYLGRVGTKTTIESGINLWLSGFSTHNIHGSLENNGALTISQTDSIIRNPGGQSSYMGTGSLANRGSILLNDVSAASAPTYNWQLDGFTNDGTMQWCGRGDTGGSTFILQCDTGDCTNNGLIVFEQVNDNKGTAATWQSRSIALGPSVTNNGGFLMRQARVDFVHNVQGSGCFMIDQAATMYMHDGTGLYQNPNNGQAFDGQSISFTSSRGVLHLDSGAYYKTGTFGPEIYGFGGDNAIEFSQYIIGWTYSGSTITVKFYGGTSVALKIGSGYDASNFFKKPQVNKYGSYNAIYYNGDAARGAGSAPGQCQRSAPVCAALPATGFPNGAPATTSSAAPTSTTAAPTSSTAAPTTSTAAPTSSTAAPTSSTAVPTSSTAAPTSSTAAPTSSTAAPTTSTAAPTSSTAAPTSSTAAPSSSTAAPTSSTAAPTSSTAPPTSSTAAPTSTAAPSTTSSIVPSAPTAPVIPNDVFNYGGQSVGCFRDNLGFGGDRTLPSARFQTASMTPEYCSNQCGLLGFKYSGTEYGSECYCGAVAPTTTSEDCNVPCAGRSSQMCGGSWALTVYDNTNIKGSVSDAALKSLGCFADNLGSRTLQGYTFAADNMTQAVCAAQCSSRGFAFSGTEYGRECYCAPYAPQVKSTACTMTCAGSNGELCGGPNALTVLQDTKVKAADAPSCPSLPAGYVVCKEGEQVKGGKCVPVLV